MNEIFKAIKISDKVYFVGAIDWSIRDFHGYSTNRGTTYNAYLILADKITLIDTVKAPFRDELISRIASVVDPEKIDYIISNHSEMDHTGCLPEVIKTVKPEKVFTSKIGAKTLAEHFKLENEITAVNDGESISLGNMNLTFFEARMLHWPESMFSYLPEQGLLFSQDAFGMHLAASERFADEIDQRLLEHEGAKYFANILLPFSSFVIKLLEKMDRLSLTIKMLAPDHGPIWRKDVTRMPELYSGWAAQKPTNKAVIAYDTMWGSTAAMARAIGEGLVSGGASVKLMPLKSSHRSDVATEILDAGAFVVGSPTINNNMFPTVADLLYYIKGLKPQNPIGSAFGSYGWSGEATGQIEDILKGMNVELADHGVRIKYVPYEEELKQCYHLGNLIAKKLGERVK
jgi:flavorubredoxin